MLFKGYLNKVSIPYGPSDSLQYFLNVYYASDNTTGFGVIVLAFLELIALNKSHDEYIYYNHEA